jgi:hypothetical protein
MIPGLSKVLSSAAPEEQLGILRDVYKVLSGEVIHGNRQPLLDIMYGLAGLKFVDPFEHEGLEDIASQLSRDPLSRSLQMGVSSGVYEQFAADTDFDALTVGFARAVRAQVGEEGGIELLFGKHGRTKSSTVDDIESVTPDKMKELRYGRLQMEEDILNRFREAGAIYGPLGERVTDLNMMARYATLRFAQARMRPQDALELEEIAMAGEGIPDAAIKFLASKQVPGSQLGALFGDRGISGDKPVDTEMLREMLHFPQTFEDFKKQIVSPEQLAQAGKALTVSKRDMGSPFGLLRSMASLFFAEFGADDFITDKPGFYRDISAVAQVYQSLLDLDQLTREEGAALGMMRVKMSAGGNLTYRNAATGEWETPVGNPAGFVSNVLGIRTESGRKAIARLMTAQGQMAARIQAGFKKPAGMMGVAEDDAQSVTYNDGAVGLYLGYGDEVKDKFILGIRDLMANTSLEALEAAVKFMEAGATPLQNKNIPEKDQVFAHIQPTEQEILEWLGNNPDSTEMIIGMMSGKRPPSHSGSRGTASGAEASAVDFFAGLSKSFESALARVLGGDFGENLKVYVHDREPAVQAINMSGMYAYGAMGAPEGLLDSARRVQDKSFKSGALSLMRGNVTNYNPNQIRHISNLLGFLGSSEEIAHGFVSTEFGEDGGPNQSAVDMLFGKEGPWSKYLVSAIQDVGREVTNARPSDVPRVQEHIENLANIGTEMAEASKRFATVSEVEGDAADRAAKQLSNLSGVIATTSEAMKTGLDSMFAPDTGLIAEYTQTLKDGVPILEAHLSKMQNLASGEGRLTAEQQRERAEASEFLRNYRSMSGAAGAPMPEQVQDLELAIDKVGILRSRPEQSGVKGIWEKLSDPRKSFGSDMYFMMRNMRMFIDPLISGGQQYQQYQLGMNQLRATTGMEPNMQAREVMANMQGIQLAKARTGGYILSGLNGMLGDDGVGSQGVADVLGIGGASLGVGMMGGQFASILGAGTSAGPIGILLAALVGGGLSVARAAGESKDEERMRAQIVAAGGMDKMHERLAVPISIPSTTDAGGLPATFVPMNIFDPKELYEDRTGYTGSAQYTADQGLVAALRRGEAPTTGMQIEYMYGEGGAEEYAGVRAMLAKQGYADPAEFGYGLGRFVGAPVDISSFSLPEEILEPYGELQKSVEEGGMGIGKFNSLLVNLAVSTGKVNEEIAPFITDFLDKIKGDDFQKLARMGLLPQYIEEYAGAESNAMRLGIGPSQWSGQLLGGGLGITQREDYQRYLQLAQGLASYGVTLNEPGSLAGPGEAAAYMEKEQLVGQAGQFLYNKTVMPSDQISAVLNGLQAGGTEDNYQLRLQLRAFSGDATAAYQLQQMQSAPSNLLAINDGDAYIDRPIKMSYSGNPGRELFDRSTLPIQISAPFGKLGGVQNNIGGLGALPWFYQGMESTGQPLFATQKVFGDTSPGQAMLGQYNQQLGKLGMGSMSYIPDRQSLSIQAWQSGYDATMASIGSTIAGIKERMDKLPDIRFWQDELRTISIDSANRDLEFQQRALDLNIAQQREGFALSQEQITTKSQWLTEDTARARGRLGTQTSWQAEDYAANKAMSQMQFGWKMQDIQRDLRFATGPQREALLRQQERETIGFNFQQAQADKQFGRGMTQAGWSLEDIGINEERQRKSIEWEQRRLDMSMKYFELESALQQERINAAMEDNGRRIEAETKLRDIQREMEDNDLKRSLAAAGAQAAHAKKMHDIEGQVRAIDMLQGVMNGLQVVHIMKMTTGSSNLFASIETGTTKVQKDFEEKVNPALDLATEKLADVSGVVLQFSEGWETFGTDIETWFNVVWGGENGLWNRKFSAPWHEFMYDFDLWIQRIQLPTGGGGGGGGGINPGGNNELRALGGPILHPTVSALAEHGEEYVVPSHGQLVLRGGSGRDTELLSMILATLMRIEAAGLRFVTVDARGATTGVKTDSLYMLLNTA